MGGCNGSGTAKKSRTSLEKFRHQMRPDDLLAHLSLNIPLTDKVFDSVLPKQSITCVGRTHERTDGIFHRFASSNLGIKKFNGKE